MKKLLITLSFILVCALSYTQEVPKVGDVLTIKEPSGQFYNHVSFPRLNILVKRGKVASYKPVIGNTVVVDKVIIDDDNKAYVILKKKDGTKFFGLKTTVKANYLRALKSGEIALAKN